MKAIGLMSGTSMDAVDVALLETDGETIQAFGPTEAYPYTKPERQLLREAVEWARGVTRKDDRSGVLSLAEKLITDKHIDAVRAFAGTHGVALSAVDAIGFHGQTVTHQPERGFSLQLGDGKALAKALGVQVVYDFRAADVEAGGEGAPLVPIYHHALARKAALAAPVAFVNIGGIANVTYVPDGPATDLIAFDAGPGNALLDDWMQDRRGMPSDENGSLAMTGTVDGQVLTALLSHPYFLTPPPKSLDRTTFSGQGASHLSDADGAATLTAFTVAGIGAAARHFPARVTAWIVTGGGAKNVAMVEGLRRVLNTSVKTADEAGFSADFMEAQAFAFLAARFMTERPSSFPGTTGVSQPTRCGVLASPL
jgi:anhydro-N-acetylmuramic acid kinase